MPKKRLKKMEFHVSRASRDLHKFDESLYSLSGNVIFPNFHAARVFAQKMNARRDLAAFPEQTVRAGQINAIGLIDELLHIMIQRYQVQRNPEAMERALTWLDEMIGEEAVDTALESFGKQFPTVAVYKGEVSLEAYLEGASVQADGRETPNREIVLEEMLMLWLANANPAFDPFLELFDDEALEKNTEYIGIIASLYDFYETQPKFGPQGQNLIDLLRSPARAAPHSLTGQLEFIREQWGSVIGEYLYLLLSSMDLIKEEEKAVFWGPGPAIVYDFTGIEEEPERFSQDKDWMPSLVLLAKNSYVWLDQLSKKHKRKITRLDQIPDEELDALAHWGFSGLWLIGLWERSQASRKIKQMRGNPEAVASAYSLFSYDIASDLGGEQAYQNLHDRAWQRGIRLASDMVPNHMGIDSRWVVEHPDWFVSLDYSPFPTYTFYGPNLSWDSRVGIYLEDHYYDNSDAAVVFKRVDFWTGAEKYIYHGNDGTSMPWNDTAQLNYLLPEVREAVIQTILHVARKFPVIRFDAAMTLAKKHYQRLWFPEPGSGGDIPSRAEHGLTKEQFNQAFPEEFWREVVDRVAQEVPETLLLAEAFWMMEGYFVRTLGMHRVYNSAFMIMLRDEKNQEYRLVIKNTIEFDPEILKRYVNFMNNPDEETAADQFGKGDKYFGICTLMATLPGLPMFGHGQLEGFTEKYGMEYQRAYWDEEVDQNLVERHEREIFPLLRRRYIFAEAHNFALYDFYAPEGHVNENVFAYSNQAGEERSLVVYHNKFADAMGWIRMSAAFTIKAGDGDEREMVRKTLGEGLALINDEHYFTIFRDHISGLEYIRNNRELIDQGLYIELKAYQCHVFMDFRQALDNEDREYAHLAEHLDGKGVTSVDEALKEIFLQPVLEPFRSLLNVELLSRLIQNRRSVEVIDAKALQDVHTEVDERVHGLTGAILDMIGVESDALPVLAEILKELELILSLPDLSGCLPDTGTRKCKTALAYLESGPEEGAEVKKGDPALWGTLLSWLFVHKLGRLAVSSPVASEESAEQSRTWIDEWLFGKVIRNTLIGMGLTAENAGRQVGLVQLLTGHQAWFETYDRQDGGLYQVLRSLLNDSQGQQFLMVNRFQDVLWFNKESYRAVVWWLYIISVLDFCTQANREDVGYEKTVTDSILKRYDLVHRLLKAATVSEYQVAKLLEAAKEQQF